MMSRKFINKISVIALLFLSVACKIDADKASREAMKQCVAAQEVLYESIELSNAFMEMLTSYNETCHDEELCTYQIHDDTVNVITGLHENSTIKDVTNVKGSGAAHFGGAFYEHETFKKYSTACDDAGGVIICVDASLVLEGEAGAALLEDDKGVETDVKLAITSYPVCMTEDCVNQDLTTILENSAKNAVLKAPQVAEHMGTKAETMVKAASVKQVCALSGLETCLFIVVEQKCGLLHPGGGGFTKAAGVMLLLGSVLVFVSGSVVYRKSTNKVN